MKFLRLLNILLPFNNVTKNILFYLLLSPIINCFLTNLYYYNCGGSFNSIQNIFTILNLAFINPFKSRRRCSY